MEAYVLDWMNLLLRWLHLIAGVAWIGASFYFVMLDNSLRPPQKEDERQRGVLGELWAVHGGGFYNSRKFPTGPKGEPLSEHLHWSKWEAYTTWLSGMGLLALIYWYGASTFLIDRNVMALSPPAAIAISIAFVAGGWFVYDTLCRAFRGRDTLLAVVVFAFVMACTWALFGMFGARAAYMHAGAMLGTMMVGNVFFHIIPGQKRMVASIRAGQNPDRRLGMIGKQRSVHNTYFTLPVLFVMISGHYPMTYAHPQGWLVLGVVMLAGMLIRQFFVLRHRHVVRPALPALGAALLLGVAIALVPSSPTDNGMATDMAQVQTIVAQRCNSCHAQAPTHEGLAQAPKGIVLETPEQIVQHALKVAETVANRYMPIGNLTQMTDDERTAIAGWYARGAPAR